MEVCRPATLLAGVHAVSAAAALYNQPFYWQRYIIISINTITNGPSGPRRRVDLSASYDPPSAVATRSGAVMG